MKIVYNGNSNPEWVKSSAAYKWYCVLKIHRQITLLPIVRNKGNNESCNNF